MTKKTTQPKPKIDVPSWLFFGILRGEKKWDDEKQALAESIIKSLKQKDEFYCWPKEILEKVLYVNKHDNCGMYSAQEPKR